MNGKTIVRLWNDEKIMTLVTKLSIRAGKRECCVLADLIIMYSSSWSCLSESSPDYIMDNKHTLSYAYMSWSCCSVLS